MNKRSIQKFTSAYVSEVKQLLDTFDTPAFSKAVLRLLDAHKHGKTIYLIGNGGSASTCLHIACDLGKGTICDFEDDTEKRFKVISLAENVAFMTALGNDLSYKDIFVQQLQNMARSGDVVVVLSVSGNSPNLVRAVEYSKSHKILTVGFLGNETGGKLGEMVDYPVIVKSKQYGPVEDLHSILGHMAAAVLYELKTKKSATGKNHTTPFQMKR